MTDYTALIATIKPAAWWSEKVYTKAIDALRPFEASYEAGPREAWFKARNAAIEAYKAKIQPSPETGDLFGGKI